jgi:stress response protein SCP2
MEGHLLRKGANVSLLSRNDPSARLQAVVRWADPRGAADVDVSALLLGPDGRVRSDADFVFYNAPSGGDGSVRLLGKRADDEAGEDRVAVDLEALPPDIERVVIAASLDAGEGVGFGALPELGLVLLDAEGSPSVRFDVDDVGPETAIVLGELYSRGEDWKFRAVGQGWDTGLAGLATDFGISVASEPSEDPPSVADAPVHEVPPVVAPPAEEPAADLVEVPVDDIGVDELVAGESWVATEAATESAPQQRGVRTRKKRTLVTSVAPPALAESASWHPARLFSITGVGTAREQEQRATSTLLSSMMAVRDFGRALVGRFGGPAGAIEAYPEVPFTMADGTTVRPDGVIRVARGGRTWTALLETKTGTNGHRVEQVERYLDLARQQEYQAVVTLSNELTPVGGAHPVAVDKRKTQKVALHHIAWSEVLHEAQMQLAHRGVADRLQAWLLAELIRYLEHPRSGAAGFEDMGPSWVAVRDAVVARTLRPTDHKVGSVTTSWDRLMRHICLRLTHEHGTNFSPAHPRALAANPAARAQAAATRLANEGTLSTTLRSGRTAGPLTITADLRTAQIRTALDIDAPQEGGPSKRLNWLLRQLASAPDSTTIEAAFARRGQTACELLKDVRSNPALLLPHASAEVRSFRIALCAPLGPKRSGQKQAFVPSVNAAVDAFYEQVVSSLRAPSGS